VAAGEARDGQQERRLGRSHRAGRRSLLRGRTALYQGHLVVWFGGGDNSQGQQEFGTTVNFTGTGLSNSAQTLSLHVSFGGAIPHQHDAHG